MPPCAYAAAIECASTADRASSRYWAAKTAHVTNARILHLGNVSRSELC
jgi:hypothetical protein